MNLLLRNRLDRLILPLLGLLFPVITFAQSKIYGNIIDKDTHDKIPFATIGLIKQNSGTNADENGRFELNEFSSKSFDDTLLVTCVGYLNIKIPASGFPKNGLIELSRKPTALDAVVIDGKYKWNFVSLNEEGNCGTNYWVGSNYTSQIAQHFYAPAENSRLTQVQVCKDGIPVIAPNTCLFRIRVYTLDTLSMQPGFDLTDSVIEVKASGRHIQIDLEKYHIVIPQHDFFVAVKWLKIPFNEDHESYKSQGNKVTRTLYGPYLAVKYQKSSQSSKSISCWHLTYKNQWLPMPGSNAQIAATLKY